MPNARAARGTGSTRGVPNPPNLAPLFGLINNELGGDVRRPGSICACRWPAAYQPAATKAGLQKAHISQTTQFLPGGEFLCPKALYQVIMAQADLSRCTIPNALILATMLDKTLFSGFQCLRPPNPRDAASSRLISHERGGT
jgi:hypothetical protein